MTPMITASEALEMPVLPAVRLADRLDAPEGCTGTPQNAPEANSEEMMAEAFTPDTEGKVDWVLGKIAAHRAEAKLIRENAEMMAREHDREAEGLEWRYVAALQTWLRGEIAGSKKKSKRLFHGVLGYRTKPASVSVTDEAAALDWARVNLPAAVTERLDRKTLADVLLSTGESLSFAVLTPEDETFYIK